ncbi:propanol-preferring alcohol dehydrogenase [Amycolatopsis bartoniae]|uniref:alcohol dehydrogenase n=1 Tax=Amycolatopsis bartoniae TaxID=941986 RepID=A0A8H9MAB9_9PSEU|nr:zinc-binding dehydrogenase [Amycolatopsis bartoniae]MBB2939935.1 propanol-preferring alcohol dehydrogenase [Amycolatopsis bartoniae]TVT08282.1 zinc-binding dehydrogenase [Amycolatopsis bartoniae]GHF35609.1 zinc-dependent alcohol dehydrogenase [Amycolatopsis bartoniae]
MRAWQFVAVGKSLECREVPEPRAGTGEVVVDVRAAGLCHTDVGTMEGALEGLLDHVPMTIGHEIAGVISEVGSGVSQWTVGDRVVIPAVMGGAGSGRDGGFAGKVIGLADELVAIPDGVSFAEAAAATDAGMTSYKAVRVAGVGAGTKLGVVGLGGLGMVGARIALLKGAEVYAAELKEEVWDKAKAVGVTACARSITEFADAGLDVIIDFAGADTTKDAIETVRPGGRVVQIGVFRATGELPVLTLVMKEVELLGSNSGTHEDVTGYLGLVAAGKLDGGLGTISFDEIGEGMDRLRRGEVSGRLVALV